MRVAGGRARQVGKGERGKAGAAAVAPREALAEAVEGSAQLAELRAEGVALEHEAPCACPDWDAVWAGATQGPRKWVKNKRQGNKWWSRLGKTSPGKRWHLAEWKNKSIRRAPAHQNT